MIYFTRQEQKAILCIAAFFLIGIAVHVVCKLNPSFIQPTEHYPETKKASCNLNTATIAELIEVPGIGPQTAEKIMKRRSVKKFQSIDELKEIDGIKEKKFLRLKEYLDAP